MLENNFTAKPKILYVEDHEESAKILITIFKKECDIINAVSVSEALEKLKSVQFDLIIMDIALHTKFDGLELISKLKSDEKYKNIPIIALTAHAMHGDKEKILDGGADDYVSKPFYKNILIEKINRLINHFQ
ncbi:MAG: response regulator [Bacteroidetes bacterium]|nr:response regulator [Bacteroidota bacterium]MBU2585514.1 response regulator [Bacteroidota bacterium]